MKPTVDDLICKSCGWPAKNAIYRNVEVTGVGWAYVELGLTDNDEVTAEVDRHVQEIDYEGSRIELAWGCSQCGKEKHSLEDLVVLESASLDPVRWVQKHPLPGQIRLPLADTPNT